ncbi:MAG: hypothetical protein U9R66_07785 [Thermodesulfobacteriota bacterium]|nr:hypothetical protein [Thermodesulfobacteriota bacterium]
MVHYVHHIPGRLRVKIPALRNQKKMCCSLQNDLAGYFGVRKTRVNPSTGSVIVEYDYRLRQADDILAVLKQKRLISDQNIVSKDAFLRGKAEKVGEKIGKALIGKVAEKTLQAHGLSILAALI